MQSWFRACSPAARVLRSTPAVRHRSHRHAPMAVPPRRHAAPGCDVLQSRHLHLVNRRARVWAEGWNGKGWSGAGSIRCILLTLRVDCHRVQTQNRGLALANLPARVALRSIAPLTTALPTPARGFSVGAPARDELERTEAVTSELQYVAHTRVYADLRGRSSSLLCLSAGTTASGSRTSCRR